MKRNLFFNVLTFLIFLGVSSCFCWVNAQESEGQYTVKLETIEGGKIDLDFKNVKFGEALRIFTEKTGVKFVTSEELAKKTITIYLPDVGIEEALHAILTANGLVHEKLEGTNIYVVKEMAGIPTLAGIETTTRIFTLKHVDAEDIKKSLSGMATQYGIIETMTRTKGVGSEKTEGRSNILMITDIPSNLKKLEKIVSQLDQPSPQIMIQTRIIEVSLDREADIGIDWNLQASATGASRPTTSPFNKKYTGRDSKHFPRTDPSSEDFPARGGFPYPGSDNFTFGTLSFADFSAVLKLIESTTDTNILSAPKITTLDNQEAEIHVGKVIPIPTYTYNTESSAYEITGYEEQEIGITLKVTPHVSGEDIVMVVSPEISEIIGWLVGPSGQEEKPKLSVRRANTQARVRNGETIVIGGLIKDSEGKTVSKVPILGDIPLIGLLFRKHKPTKEKIDLLIFLTPYILTDEKAKEIKDKDTNRIEKTGLKIKE